MSNTKDDLEHRHAAGALIPPEDGSHVNKRRVSFGAMMPDWMNGRTAEDIESINLLISVRAALKNGGMAQNPDVNQLVLRIESLFERLGVETK